VFLSAAGDLLPLPTSTVLLAEMIPIIVSQGVAPLFIERIPFWFKIIIITLMSVAAFIIVAFSHNVEFTIFGIVIGSIASGFGELIFMTLSSFYHPNTVSLYSSGTGAAGIFGSLSYLALNVLLKLSPFVTLLSLTWVPLLMSIMYFFVLEKSIKIKTEFDLCSNVNEIESSSLINENEKKYYTVREKLYYQLELAKYTGPLFLVYFGEYVINQGISPALLFPNDRTFAGNEYKYYSFIYQIGVFISRSSANFFQIKKLLLLGCLQIVNMIFLGCVAYFYFIPSIWIIFVIIFYEGLIGGAVFVNAFYRVSAEVKDAMKKEFCMSSISFWYSIGILLAGVVGLFTYQWFMNLHPLIAPTPSPMPMPVPAPAPVPAPVPAPAPKPVPAPAIVRR